MNERSHDSGTGGNRGIGGPSLLSRLRSSELVAVPNAARVEPTEARLPRRFWAGIVFLALGQVFTLVHLRPWSDSWYALVWTGYILAGDGWLLRRDGESLLTRRRDAALMVVVSALSWWVFELANLLFGAWSYSKSPDIPLAVQAVRSTVAFATLMPATWITTLLTLPWFARWRATSTRGVPVAVCAVLMVLGVAVAVAIPFAPRVGLALFLASLLLVVDPLNHLRERPSLIGAVWKRDWRIILALLVGGPLSGVIGEAWNYPADPKWTYDVPYIDFLYIFEMPLIGYAGYAVLSCALYSMYHAIRPRSFGGNGDRDTPMGWAGL